MFKWIKCSDQLPEEKGYYLVVKQIFNFQLMDVVRFTNNLYEVDDLDFPKDRYDDVSGWYECDDEMGYYILDNVTHWSKLPPLPED